MYLVLKLEKEHVAGNKLEIKPLIKNPSLRRPPMPT